MTVNANALEGTRYVQIVYTGKTSRVEVHLEVVGPTGVPTATMWVIFPDGLAVEVINFEEALEQM